MIRILSICVLFSGCAINTCKVAIDNLQPVQKIPNIVNVQINGIIKTDDGGSVFLKNYTIMNQQIKNIKDACS